MLSVAPLLLGLIGVSTGPEAPVRLSELSQRAQVFVWDRGTRPGHADNSDVFFDWSSACDVSTSRISLEEARVRACPDCPMQAYRVAAVLARYGLSEDLFNGSLLKAMQGMVGSPLFILAPSVHPGAWAEHLAFPSSRNREGELHLSNILDFMRIVDWANERDERVGNVSEMMNLLLGGSYLARTRAVIQDRYPRSSYESDEAWAHSILQSGIIDASTFLSFVLESGDVVRHMPIETRASYIESAILVAAMAIRHRMAVASTQSLQSALAADYALETAYLAFLDNRFDGSALLGDLRRSWTTFEQHSHLDERQLIDAAAANCEQRSRSMADSLAQLAQLGAADLYLVSFGPLHLHGILRGLEKHRLSYVLLAPIAHDDTTPAILKSPPDEMASYR